MGVAFRVRNVYYSQEIRWIELVSGKALLLYFSKVSTVLQKVQNLSFSNYFSMLTILVGCSLMFL